MADNGQHHRHCHTDLRLYKLAKIHGRYCCCYKTWGERMTWQSWQQSGDGQQQPCQQSGDGLSGLSSDGEPWQQSGDWPPGLSSDGQPWQQNRDAPPGLSSEGQPWQQSGDGQPGSSRDGQRWQQSGDGQRSDGREVMYVVRSVRKDGRSRTSKAKDR